MSRRTSNADSRRQLAEPRAGMVRRAGRLALWAAVVLLLLRGATDVVRPSEPASQDVRAGSEERLSVAGAFAVRFARAYMDGATAEVEGLLADGVSDQAAPVVPSRDRGTRVAWAMVAREAFLGGLRAQITVACFLRDGGQRWLGVPVVWDRLGRMAVADLPSLTSPASRGPIAVRDSEPLTDRGAAGLIGRFLRAYLAGRDQAALSDYLLPGRRLAAMPTGLELTEIVDVDQVAANGRALVAAVRVRVREAASGAVYPLSYRLRLARRERLYVVGVEGARRA